MKFVKEKRLCLLSLKDTHWTDKCEVKEGCTKKNCKNPRHHTLLHDRERDKPSETVQQEVEASQPENVCSNLCNLSQEESESKNNLPLLATLPVKVSSNSREFCTCA